jgi:tetratricopeptide (TPR) repeat protein
LAANVAEPYLDGAIRPEILFPAYLSGFNLVEAFYLASPYLSWQTVVIGDPLCAPFRKTQLTAAEIADPVDPATELPGLFAKRRLETVRLTLKGAPGMVVALSVRAETRAARGDKEGARRALEEAAAAAPDFALIQLRLAMMHDAAGDYPAAIDRYQRVVKLQPQNVIALNNLAYGLAVREKKFDEALPLARRALSLASGDATIADTVAWIEHLAGNDAEAVRVITPFVTKRTTTAEIHFHAAVIFAATGDRVAATTQLKQALQVDASMAAREDVQVLRRQLDIRRP